MAGITHDRIAQSIENSEPTLRKHYRSKLDRGGIEAEAGLKISAPRPATGEWDEEGQRWTREPNVTMA